MGILYGGSAHLHCGDLPVGLDFGMGDAEDRQRLGLNPVSRRDGYPDHAGNFFTALRVALTAHSVEIQVKTVEGGGKANHLCPGTHHTFRTLNSGGVELLCLVKWLHKNPFYWK